MMDGVDSGYKAMVLDQHVIELGLYAMNKMEAAHIWVEYNVKDILQNVGCEEDRADCVDDGFDITELPFIVANTTRSKKKLLVKRKGDMGESSAVGEGFAALITKQHLSKDVKVTEIMHDKRRTHSLQVSFGRAKEVVEGDAAKQYSLLWRPFIGVDGCFLKTKYGGQLLIAVGRDANDEYFPLAFGLVETKMQMT
ncbi:pentatricopeptide repeat-containing protein at1g77405-like protein [Trifolium pratense]|uniref:Pentatricopeptide repeat-containing protein at1g77405-like protein n=1 Tax=Trifolium pratense TaxID=57577 RepID=A0A2K3L673_TRIPR|nr:pentatricopeptide repeat-containing protein at1g77405-like protein [Trifolium pratense]